MFVYEINEPNSGLRGVIEGLKQHGIRQESRNGPVMRFPRPVCLQYNNPQARLLTSPIRDANHVFHLFETMWMFAGMNELGPLLTYNSGMAQYSDDGKMLRGTAYGYRWRNHGTWDDQIEKVVKTLKANPDDRRCVLTMWDARELGTDSKDYACNLQVIFSTRPPRGKSRYTLDMTVTNRSNDLIYGAMGSNMFHFSLLLEYIAHLVNMEVGVYYQVSSNLHLYTDNPTAKRCYDQHTDLTADEVSSGKDLTLTNLGLTMDKEVIKKFIQNRDTLTEQPYIQTVVLPLVEAYHLYKLKSRLGVATSAVLRLSLIKSLCDSCASPALGQAALQWFTRKMEGKA
jgi:thymidylate synthase